MTSEERDAACERISKGDKQKNQPDILRHSHRGTEMKIQNCTQSTVRYKGAAPSVRPPGSRPCLSKTLRTQSQHPFSEY